MQDDYRTAVRDWLAEHVPSRVAETPDEELAFGREFQALLYDAGFAGITWPKEVGGQGLGAPEQQAFHEEASRYDLPVGPFLIGMGMCGPTLVDLGTDAQKERYLKPMLRGTEVWCQLFSEPGAGSDVASLSTKAVRDGEGWRLNGQKVWTSNAQWADFAAVLTRTDPDQPKHRGMTMFVLDMKQPGVTVRPLVDMTGHSPFNEVYLDDAYVPDDAVIGEVGKGWSAATTMLGHERVSISGMRHRRASGLTFAAVAEQARRNGSDTDPVVRGRLADLYVHERARELFTNRLRQEAAAGTPPGSRGSVGKLAGALLLWRAIDVAADVAGAHTVGWDDDPGAALSLGIESAPASSIAGGTNDIQRSIIGERVLGLPREPSVDRDVPFRELRTGSTREA